MSGLYTTAAELSGTEEKHSSYILIKHPEAVTYNML